MLVNFMLMCVSVLVLPRRNPELAKEIKVVTSRPLQVALGAAGTVFLGGFLGIHIVKDIRADAAAWYFHSTPVWLIVMAVASLIFWREYRKLKRSGADINTIFSTLPPE
jgi:hypothetical protein